MNQQIVDQLAKDILSLIGKEQPAQQNIGTRATKLNQRVYSEARSRGLVGQVGHKQEGQIVGYSGVRYANLIAWCRYAEKRFAA